MDKEPDAKSPPPVSELTALSPSGAQTPPLVTKEPPPAAADDPRAAASDAAQKKRGRKRKPVLEAVDPDEAKRVHNANNKKLRDDQNELFAQLKRLVGIEAQAKKTTVLIRVVEHMQRQEETIISQRRKLQEYEQAAHVMKPSSVEPLPMAMSMPIPMPVAEPDPVPVPVPMAMHSIVPTFLSPREVALSEQLAGAQKALMSMQASQRDLKVELERWKNRTKLAEERSSPTKSEIPRRNSAKKLLLLGPPAAMLPRPRTASPAGSTDELSRDDDRKGTPMDALASLSTLALAAESPALLRSGFADSHLRMPLAAAGLSATESDARITGHEWLGHADLKVSFWRHGKALRHQPGRPNPSVDKIASRLYKLPRPLFDCRHSGRDVKHEENQGSCAAPACCRPLEDNNWVTLACGDRIHKECNTDAAQSCYASRSVFFVPPPSVQLWRVDDTVCLVPTHAATDKLLGCISCFAKNDGPALAIPFSVLGPLKDAGLDKVVNHVEIRHGVFKGDAIVEMDGDDLEKEEKEAPRANRSASPAGAGNNSPSSAHPNEELYPLVHHLTAQSSPDSNVLHLCFKQNTSIRHRSHRRDATEVTRVFRLRFNAPDGSALYSAWFFLAATSWAALAEKGARMLPGEHTTGVQVLEALIEAGGAAE